MPSFQQFLQTTIWNNTGQNYLIALGIFIGLFIIFKIFDSAIVTFLKKHAKKTKIKWDDIVIDFISAIHWQFYVFVAFYIGSLTLELPGIRIFK